MSSALVESAVSAASTPTKPGRFACATTVKQFDGLAASWRQLDEHVASPIEQLAWSRTCVAALLGSDRLALWAVAEGASLTAVAPLVERRLGGIRRLLLLGIHDLNEPAGLAHRDRQSLDRLTRKLVRTGWPLFLERVPADSPTVESLRDASSHRAIMVSRPQASCPYISLDEKWLEPEQNMNAGRRSDLRRARRKAEQLGPVTTEILTPDSHELDALLDQAFEIEARSWKGDAGTALARDSARAAFYRAYAHVACRDTTLRMCFLRIGGRAAAMQIALQQSGGFWLLKVGYDAEFSACSPGLLLMRDTIRHAAAAGLQTYEFLGKAEAWTEVWTKQLRECVSLRIYPYSLRGLAALAADGSRTLAKQGGGRLRATARRAVSACAYPLLKRAARAYIAGDRLDDALRVQENLARTGVAATLGYWDGAGDSPRAVADQYLAAIRALGENGFGGYVSIKAPALKFSDELLAEVVEAARQHAVRVHFDSLGPETANRTRTLIDKLLSNNGPVELGCTLPARWRRSVDDADWAADRQLPVRVVKGQWADLADPNRDLRQGYLEVIDRLAGKARHVAVASHDAPLAEEALARLRAAGTSCEMELLYGLPMQESLRLARRLNVPARVYIPFGQSYLPYALGSARRNPRIFWWLAKDFVAAKLTGAVRLTARA